MQTQQLRPVVQVLVVEGPTAAMEAAYFQLAPDQQAVTLLARLDGWQAGMAPVTVNVTMSQHVAGGVVPLNSADLTLWTQQLYWDSARNTTQAVSLNVPLVSLLMILPLQLVDHCANCKCAECLGVQCPLADGALNSPQQLYFNKYLPQCSDRLRSWCCAQGKRFSHRALVVSLADATNADVHPTAHSTIVSAAAEDDFTVSFEAAVNKVHADAWCARRVNWDVLGAVCDCGTELGCVCKITEPKPCKHHASSISMARPVRPGGLRRLCIRATRPASW